MNQTDRSLDESSKKFAKNFLKKALRPDENITVSEWSDRYRVLSGTSSSEPGKWRTSRTPYLKEIMDNLSPISPVQEIIFMKGAQVGGTEAGNNWILSIIDYFPGPTMAVQPTTDTAKRWSSLRILPAINDTPRCRDKIQTKEQSKVNKIQEKNFPGGVLIITGANSPVGLRSVPVKYLFLDEVDAYPLDCEGEGDPILLAERRTATFKNKKKIFKVSTPTDFKTSRIDYDYNERSSKGVYKIPCPHCKNFFKLQFSRLRYTFENGVVGKTTYQCEFCNNHIEEYQKTFMLDTENGAHWEHEFPEREVKGYHLNALYSPFGWYSWREAAQMFEESKGKSDREKVFKNTVLGEVWKPETVTPKWDTVYQNREKYTIGVVPHGGVILTAGVDVQKDRLEVEIVAWGKNLESWSIDYKVLMGDTNAEDVWKELATVLETPIEHESGVELKILQMAVDSGFNTQSVYAWTRKYENSKVIAVKNHARDSIILSQPTLVDLNHNGVKIKEGVKLWHGSSTLCKKEVFDFLETTYGSKALERDPNTPVRGLCHFPMYDAEFFKQLTAEEQQIKKNKGYSKLEWVKVRDRNEVLDCRCLARMALYRLSVDRWLDSKWEEVNFNQGLPAENLHKKSLPEGKKELALENSLSYNNPIPQKREVKRSSFVYGR